MAKVQKGALPIFVACEQAIVEIILSIVGTTKQIQYYCTIHHYERVSIHEQEHKPNRIGREQYVQLIALKSSNFIMLKPIKEPHNKPYFKFNQSIHNLTFQKYEMSSNLILRALQKQQNVGTVITPNKIETILGVLLSILEVCYYSFSYINLAFCFCALICYSCLLNLLGASYIYYLYLKILLKTSIQIIYYLIQNNF